MLFPRSSFQLAAVCVTVFTLFVWFLSSHSATTSFPHRVSEKYLKYSSSRVGAPPVKTETVNGDINEAASDPIWDITNRTLGFQKIYAISMPHRTDKHDSLALMGLVSDLDITFVDGVNGSDIHPKALPPYWKGEIGMGDYGCWRAHLNLYQGMIQNKIQSALVLEDDADWDILIRPQMLEFARGARAIQNSTLPLHSPYGDNWDILAVGHTGIYNKAGKDQKYWVTQNDPTVVAESRRTWWRKPDLSTPKLGGDYTRVVLEVSRLTGTAAYAISLRGAARVLYDQSMMPNAQAIDMAQSRLCRADPYGSPFCIGTYPMLFGRYRAIGPMDKDSDRRAQSNEAEAHTAKEKQGDRLEPESEFTVFPVSINIGRLMAGESVIPSYMPEVDMVKEIDLANLDFPRGEEVFVYSEEYADRQEMLAEQKKEQQKQEAAGQAEGTSTALKKDGERKEMVVDETME